MKMQFRHIKISAALLTGLLPLTSFAFEPMVYPAQGQTPEQLEKDRSECHTWAVQQSGFDPNTSATTPSAGNTLRGSARGAAAGAAIGAIAGDAGAGAAVGAGLGAIKNRRASKSSISNASGDYSRALNSCLTGRGYSVQ